MGLLIQYQVSNGLILGVWDGPMLDLLQAQIREDDPTIAYLEEADPAADAPTVFAHSYILGGARFAKTVLTVVASPSPFAADGVTECTISVTPFHACTLTVNGTTHALTVGDETLILTSDVPQTFTVALQRMAPYEADPITVEAT